MTVLDEQKGNLVYILNELKEIIAKGKEIPRGQRRTLFKLIPFTCLIVSKDSMILEYLGMESAVFTGKDAVGKHIKDFLPQDTYKLHLEVIKYVFQTKKSFSAYLELEIKNLPKYFQITYFYYSEEKAIVFLRDRTKKKRLEDYKRLELNKLKQLDKTRKLLIANISHELKTPIMTIANSTEFLETVFGDDINKEKLELIDIIQRGVDRLKRLVENLLDLSKIEFKENSLNLSKINISELIKKCIEDMSILFKNKNLNLEVKLTKKTILFIDREKIEQVIINLMSNAIKNTQPHGKVKISLEDEGYYTRIIIEDNGIGLTRKEKKKLFSMFGKFERKTKGLEFLDIRGSGLGLYLSKKIVKMHGGEIWAESDGRFKGSKFIMELPAISVENLLRIL